MRRNSATNRKNRQEKLMDIVKMDTEDAGQWGVVYSYGSVLATFENEQDAQNEADCFGGAAVRIARNIWTAICEAGLATTGPDEPRPA
jgi:pantothenate kinase type III